MPLDPNIITYGLRQMPGVDINAMVQQQITGMENINELERQRQADALAMQDRAAKQQAEAAQMQEAEAMRALLPAYTYGIQTGDIAGALNLVPPDMQESLRPYADALAGKSPQEVQAALIGSLSASEMGQNALAAIQRAQTAQIQQGQLDVSRGRLALETEQAGKPEAMTPYQEAQIALEREKMQAAQSKETAAEAQARLKEEKRAKDLDLAINEVETVMQPGNLIDQATGSYIGNLIDTAVATVGVGTPGYAATAKLAPIADLVLKMVPRFEGPQSNFDVQSYKDAAGNLANPNVPANVKRAAATEIVRLFRKYKDQFEYAGEGGAGAEEAPGVIDFGDLGD